MAILHGRNLVVIASNGLVVGARSCEINVQVDLQEVASAENTNAFRSFLVGRKDWTVNVGYLVVAGSMKNGLLAVGSTVYLTISGGANDTVTGTAIVKQCKITGTRGNLATGSFVFQGNGALT